MCPSFAIPVFVEKKTRIIMVLIDCLFVFYFLCYVLGFYFFGGTKYLTRYLNRCLPSSMRFIGNQSWLIFIYKWVWCVLKLLFYPIIKFFDINTKCWFIVDCFGRNYVIGIGLGYFYYERYKRSCMVHFIRYRGPRFKFSNVKPPVWVSLRE